MRFEIDAERCKACSYCVISCPKELFVLGSEMNSKGYHYAKIEDPGSCVLCYSCTTMCPEAAISIYKE